MMKISRQVLVGVDIGSVSVDTVILDESGTLLDGEYTRHHGQPDVVLVERLHAIEEQYDVVGVTATGTGAKRLERLTGILAVNEVVAQVEAAKALYPHVRSIIDIGGQDSKYIQLEADPAKGKGHIRLKDFAVSSMCASGTGSFLDQQAARLDFPIEQEFGEAALRSQQPARIAGRCSVFAKSDMIHLQQRGTPADDIVAGLCHALARSLKASVIGVKSLLVPVAFVGGVAANRGVIKALQEELGIAPQDMFIPDRFALMGAAGAAWSLLQEPKKSWVFSGTADVALSISEEVIEKKRMPSLHMPVDMSWNDSILDGGAFGEPVDAFLGIDIGSISTNLVLMDDSKNVLGKYYLMTASRPIDAISKGFQKIVTRFGDTLRIKGVGTTGSGRHLIGDLVRADVVVNEITAHAKAAVFADPKVDTIFEIGGQDSKYVHLTDGLVDDFTMNKACAAGTGSFLEEQAEKLNLCVEKDFSRLALSASAPADCGEQCTVFIESEVVRHQQAGGDLSDITAGLAHSIVTNYLHKVVENRPVGETIFFQGGVAFNTAVRAAFEQQTEKQLIIPPHHEVMGALGCCLLAKEALHAKQFSQSTFRGFAALEQGFTQESFLCSECANQCDINKIIVKGSEPLFYGGRCERYEVKRKAEAANGMRDLLKEREVLMFSAYAPKRKKEPHRGTIGYPRILIFHEYYPFFQAFFTELGFDILLSPPTNRGIIREGVATVASAICFPSKVAHGHAVWMKQAILEGRADYMLIPSMRETFPTAEDHPFANHCSYVQYIPDLVDEALGLKENGIALLKPSLHFRLGRKQVLRELMRSARQVGVTSKREVGRALDVALKTYEGFRQARIELGREVLRELPREGKAIVLAGKAHNIHDPGTNMHLSRILRELGIQTIPMDFLDLFQSPDVGEAWRNMTLAMGQRTLVVADAVRRDARLYAIYLANFGCVNDSIYPKFFKREMGDKPFLFLEIDEHSAEAGVVTRCEAFLDSVQNLTQSDFFPNRVRKNEYDPEGDRVLYLPHAANGMAVWAAALRACGVRAEVLPPPNERSLHWGRLCLDGKECLPCTLMTGDMIRLIKEGGVSLDKAAFFMPGSCGSCRYDLFNPLQQVVFEDHGMEDVVLVDEFKGANQKLHAIMNRRDYGVLAWQGFMAADILEKLRMHIRPYEVLPGSTDEIYRNCLENIIQTVERRGKVEQAVVETVESMMTIPKRNESRPVIGLVGEAYLRNVDYASNGLIRKLEVLGAEVRMPAIMEVLWYTLYKQRYYTKQGGKNLAGLMLRVQHGMLSKIEKKLRRHSEGVLPNAYEPRVWDVIANSGFTLDAGLGFGAAMEIAQQGVNGIVHAIPFNCVPGLMIQGLESRFRRTFPHIPFLTVAYHGQDDLSVDTRIEALLHQCRENVLAKASV